MKNNGLFRLKSGKNRKSVEPCDLIYQNNRGNEGVMTGELIRHKKEHDVTLSLLV